MQRASDEWHSLSQEFLRLAGRIERTESINLNAADLRQQAAELAQHYLRQTRSALLEAELNEQVSILDDAFSNLLQLSEGRNALSSYKRQIKRIRKITPSITTGVALHAG